MLYTSAELSKPKRLQGAFVSDKEVKRVVDFLKESGDKPEYDTSVITIGEGDIVGSTTVGWFKTIYAKKLTAFSADHHNELGLEEFLG